MQDRWSDEEAREAIARCGAPPDLALRVYTSRLIGAEDDLVLHGGGNTSVKTTIPDLFGAPREVLYVKGSGWDLATIEPAGFAAVDLPFLLRLRGLDALSDEAMVNAVRTHLVDASAPNPSIETLLHAFLPWKFVDHSHADAIVALSNQQDGERHLRRALGDQVAIVPYVKAGFDLAKVAADVHDANPGCTALALMHHGLFTFGETAEASYRRHVEIVGRAEEYLQQQRTRATLLPPKRGDTVAQARARAARFAPLLRGALAEGMGAEGRAPQSWRRWILHHRLDQGVLDFVNDPRLEQLAASGPLTPDHVIRTKKDPMVVLGVTDDLDVSREAVEDAVRNFRGAYQAYFERCAAEAGGTYTRLDDTPRVVLVPGIGLFGVGATAKEAKIAADIYQHTAAAKLLAAPLGPHTGLTDAQLFEMEYWSLEQAKLARAGRPPELAGRSVLITGAAGAIGLGVARRLLDAGAHVVLTDHDEEGIEHAAVLLRAGDRVQTAVLDVTDAGSLDEAFRSAALAFGGVDVVVVNAGTATCDPLIEHDEGEFRRVLDVNLTGAWLTMRAAARHLKLQGTGGHIVLIGSKNVMDPGAEFSAYSASKAGAHQAAKVAALELARDGIRVNTVAPDGVFHEGDVGSRLWADIGARRAASRGIDPAGLPAYYRDRNLLQAEITARHVGNAVLFFASEQTPTTGATLPVDGGLPGAFPR